MKATGIIRRFDDLGRITIPKEIKQRILGSTDLTGVPMEIFTENDCIILKKYDTPEDMTKQETAKQFTKEKSVDEGFLQNWYQDSVLETDEPVWTDEHIKEMCNDFYLIPKESINKK